MNVPYQDLTKSQKYDQATLKIDRAEALANLLQASAIEIGPSPEIIQGTAAAIADLINDVRLLSYNEFNGVKTNEDIEILKQDGCLSPVR